MFRTRALPFVTALVVAVALTVLAGCGSAADPASGSPGEGSGDSLPVVPADVGHVHGMAVNSADGLVYLGTHAGTMVVDGDSVTRVGSSTIDLMGFAAAGPDHFYASGHPGPTDELPNPVGLIESTDGGETWQPLSLGGETDFHTLGAAGGQVYGFAGQLVGTSNGRDWTTGAPDIAPASLAVDPENPDRLVATTESGPVLSKDGAQSFVHLEEAPLLLFVAWPAADSLWGVSPDGTVYVSSDGGSTWTARGDVDAPVAFAASPEGTVAVATQTQILVSADGETFDPIAEISGGGH